MGKAKRLGTKPAVAAAPGAATKKPAVAIAAVSVRRSEAAVPPATLGGEASATDEPVELYDVVCSVECVIASGLSFGPAQVAAREHNAANATPDGLPSKHDAQPIRRRTP